jgi:2-hydroxyacyl-CoA lyase 1
MMEAFGGFGAFVQEPKDIPKALNAAMKFKGPALVNIVLSQNSARKAQQFGWKT